MYSNKQLLFLLFLVSNNLSIDKTLPKWKLGPLYHFLSILHMFVGIVTIKRNATMIYLMKMTLHPLTKEATACICVTMKWIQNKSGRIDLMNTAENCGHIKSSVLALTVILMQNSCVWQQKEKNIPKKSQLRIKLIKVFSHVFCRRRCELHSRRPGVHQQGHLEAGTMPDLRVWQRSGPVWWDPVWWAE